MSGMLGPVQDTRPEKFPPILKGNTSYFQGGECAHSVDDKDGKDPRVCGTGRQELTYNTQDKENTGGWRRKGEIVYVENSSLLGHNSNVLWDSVTTAATLDVNFRAPRSSGFTSPASYPKDATAFPN